MRGSRHSLHLLQMDAGIIPAHAGLTAPKQYDKRVDRDHPRACGAHSGSYNEEQYSAGSSPRMRGSLDDRLLGHLVEGIIPAHAGLTGAHRVGFCRHRDHPRACGAHCS